MMRDAALAYALFCLLKLAGYTAAAWALKKVYRTERPSILVIGLVRTGLGMVVGAGLWGLTAAVQSPLVVLVGLPLVRVGEWWLLIWLYFDRGLRTPGRDWAWVCFGILWSFALDLPALLGVLLIGRAWVC